MPAQIYGDDAVLHGKLLQLVMPLFRLPPEAVDKNKGPLGMIRRDVDRRKSHQRICRNAHFMTIKIEVDVHGGSLHERGRDVNFGKHGGDAVIVLTFCLRHHFEIRIND